MRLPADDTISSDVLSSLSRILPGASFPGGLHHWLHTHRVLGGCVHDHAICCSVVDVVVFQMV